MSLPTIIGLYSRGVIADRTPVEITFSESCGEKKGPRIWWRGEIDQETLFTVLRDAGLLQREIS